VVICTLGENPNLNQCITKLLELKKNSVHSLEVLVVLNTAKAEVKYPPGVLLQYEAVKGYASVRNKAISVIPEDVSVIFIDDDEIPTERWLNALILKHEEYPEDVIFGPVFQNPSSPQNAYRRNFKKYFDQLIDDSTVNQAGTGNMLIPKDLIKTGWVWFDPLFNLSGSEDTDFCFKMRKRGKQIRYAKEAALYEVQGSERFDSQFLQERFIRDTANYSLVIRRNSNLSIQVWRFTSLVLRIFFFGLVSKLNKVFLPKYRAYCVSLNTFMCGRPYVSDVTKLSESPKSHL